MRWPLLFALTVLSPLAVHADGLDTTFLRRLGVEVSGVPGWMIAADSYERKWLKGRFCTAVGVALRYTPAPCDSDDYAADYNYPTIIAGVKYNMNHGVTMHRERDSDWGLLEPVDYTSRLGNIVTVYGAFERPVVSVGRWTADYTLAFGVGYSRSKYNTRDAIDNELIGSRWLIYFGAGLHATYRVSRSWGCAPAWNFITIATVRSTVPIRVRMSWRRRSPWSMSLTGRDGAKMVTELRRDRCARTAFSRWRWAWAARR